MALKYTINTQPDNGNYINQFMPAKLFSWFKIISSVFFFCMWIVYALKNWGLRSPFIFCLFPTGSWVSVRVMESFDAMSFSDVEPLSYMLSHLCLNNLSFETVEIKLHCGQGVVVGRVGSLVLPTLEDMKDYFVQIVNFLFIL